VFPAPKSGMPRIAIDRVPASRTRHMAQGILLLCACVFGLLSGVASAQMQYGYTNWTVDDGLPQNSIRGITQTPDGYIWIPTFDGLVRFDGVRFASFNRSNTKGIESNRFSSIVQGKDGELWINTDGAGLTRYHDGSFETYGQEHGIANGTVRGITRDLASHLWILSADRIERWDNTNNRFIDVTPSHTGSVFNPFIWDDAGFWASSHTRLYCFLRGHFSSYKLPPWLGGRAIFYAASDQKGAIWLEAEGGQKAILVPGPSPKFFQVARQATAHYIDRRGHVWNVRVGPRLTRDFDFISSNHAIEISPTHVFEDREQTLWLATEGQGLYQLQPQVIRTYSREEGLVDDDVYPILQDRSGAVWVGAWHTGVSRFDNGKTTNYTMRDGLPNEMVTAIAQDRSGRIWFGSHGGLSIFDHGRFRKIDSPKLPVVAQAILPDRTGTLWFGTINGLVSYKDGLTRTFTVRDGMPTNDIHVLMESRSGDIWAGGYGGIAILRHGQFTQWTKKDGLPSNNIWSLYQDADGVVWIGTYDGGLARFQDGKITRFDVANGLYSHGVYQILEDGHGYLWMSCSRGIYRVSKNELNEVASGKRHTITSIAFGKTDGLLDLVCNGGLQPAGIRSSDGKLWFPTQDGVATIDPGSVSADNQTPPVLIESVTLDHSPIMYNPSLTVPPGKRSLQIDYTALSFKKPEQVRFQYKMEGLDTSWVDAGARRTAYYSDLPPGKYVFKVIAANADGIWNHQGQAFAITVLAPFYRRWWFLALIAAVFAITIIGFSHYRVAQHRRAREAQHAFSQQLIASQESERKRIAADLHDSLGQHLVIINNLALFSLKAGDGTGNWQEAATEISTEAVNAIAEMRNVSYNLRPYHLDRLGLTKAIESLTEAVARGSGIEISVVADDVDEVLTEGLRINFYRIVQEGLQNIVKHARATAATVRIEHRGERVRLTIQDNGQGFASGARINDPAGGGFGLTGMVERAALLRGVLKVHSEPGRGTIVNMEIPVRGSQHG
jgi:signal transduction histidine kinase/ligand-binding sensor domain-containing protein